MIRAYGSFLMYYKELRKKYSINLGVLVTKSGDTQSNDSRFYCLCETHFLRYSVFIFSIWEPLLFLLIHNS